jgi:hypothetical protein
MTAISILSACSAKHNPVPLTGTWELVAATATVKDTTVSTFDPKLKMIKIINASHFAFLQHDLKGGKDSSGAAFTAGGGSYDLDDSMYTEHLDYYIDRQWENNKFQFVVKIINDTLVQKGIEKVEKLGVDRVIVEKYKRVAK